MGRSRRPQPVSEPPVADRRLPPLLRRAWYGLNQAFRRRVAHLDLTPDQYTVLRNLHEAGTTGVTQTELTARMTSDPNTIASLVERMALAKLLRRETDREDRRARRLRLTALGRRRYLAGLDIALALQDEVLANLTDAERQQFLEILAKLAEACRSAADTPAHGPDGTRWRPVLGRVGNR